MSASLLASQPVSMGQATGQVTDQATDQGVDQALDGLPLPAALLFDVDGVLVDVRDSYRQAIARTVRHFGGTCEPEAIAAIKRRGNANNDWLVTQTLLAQQGYAIELSHVQAVFEDIYQGTASQPGVWQNERLTTQSEELATLCQRIPSALVTGRPRRDAARFVEHFGLGPLFAAIVCMEDAPLKPSPEPARLALRHLQQTSAWFLGDTPDDMRCAVQADVVPIGIVAPGESAQAVVPVLFEAGACRVYTSLPAFLGATRRRFEVLP